MTQGIAYPTIDGYCFAAGDRVVVYFTDDRGLETVTSPILTVSVYGTFATQVRYAAFNDAETVVAVVQPGGIKRTASRSPLSNNRPSGHQAAKPRDAGGAVGPTGMAPKGSRRTRE